MLISTQLTVLIQIHTTPLESFMTIDSIIELPIEKQRSQILTMVRTQFTKHD